MQCTNPAIVADRNGRWKEYACGHCMPCRIQRSREYATRCMHESLYWSSSSFVTLTYDDDHLPVGGTLEKRDLVLFLKRLRKAWIETIKYFCSGEYGERKGRPHYHLILFGVPPCSCSMSVRPDEYCDCIGRSVIIDAWGKGGVPRLGTVTYDSCRYTADYITKAIWRPEDLKGRQKPFQKISNGVGAKYCDEHREELLRDLGVTMHGMQVGIPRYYVKRMGVRWSENEKDTVKQSVDKMPLVWHDMVRPPIYAEIEERRMQREANAEAKQRLKKKGLV